VRGEEGGGMGGQGKETSLGFFFLIFRVFWCLAPIF
jgi:hypothetical protein